MGKYCWPPYENSPLVQHCWLLRGLATPQQLPPSPELLQGFQHAGVIQPFMSAD